MQRNHAQMWVWTTMSRPLDGENEPDDVHWESKCMRIILLLCIEDLMLKCFNLCNSL